MKSILLFLFFIGMLQADDFERDFGRDTPAWKHVATSEDKQNIAFFKELYEKNKAPSVLDHIPHVMHWIWLGPDKFPEKSKQRVLAWMKLHPNWKHKFWTYVDQEIPCSGMEKVLLKKFQFQKVKDCYDRSDNFWEKSLALRYEILLQEGGMIVEHDVEPLSSAESFLASYDFFCSLESLQPTFLSTSVYASPCVIAAKPNHPVLEYTLAWLERNWERTEIEYSGTDLVALTNRVMTEGSLPLIMV